VTKTALVTVGPGDTLSSIARAHDVDVEQLRQWNGIDGDLIQPGDELKVVMVTGDRRTFPNEEALEEALQLAKSRASINAREAREQSGQRATSGPSSRRARSPSDELLAKSSVEQRAILAELIRGLGDRCPAAERVLFRGADAKRNGSWAIECRGGEDYAVTIKNDPGGSTQILECDILHAFGGPGCWERF